jgi:hypothetical protein
MCTHMCTTPPQKGCHEATEVVVVYVSLKVHLAPTTP